MAYIKTIPEEEAEGLVREVYDTARKTFGYVPNHAKLFSLSRGSTSDQADV